MPYRETKPFAARVGDDHICRGHEPVPHMGGPILEPGCPTVFVGAEPAACVGDEAYCQGGMFDVIVTGEPTVLIGGRSAARNGDRTDGGMLTEGCETVTIGRGKRRWVRNMVDRGGRS